MFDPRPPRWLCRFLTAGLAINCLGILVLGFTIGREITR